MGIEDSIREVTAIYLGQTQVVAVYVGSENIWPVYDEPTVTSESCFALGYWYDDGYWTDDEIWCD